MATLTRFERRALDAARAPSSLKPTMTLSSLLLYATVHFAAVATPGPGVRTLIARVIGQGLRGVFAFQLGFLVGDLICLSIAAAGLALVAKDFVSLVFVVRLIGAAYLIYIAWSLVRARTDEVAFARAASAPSSPRCR